MGQMGFRVVGGPGAGRDPGENCGHPGLPWPDDFRAESREYARGNMIGTWRDSGAGAAHRTSHHCILLNVNRQPMYYKIIRLLVISQYVMGTLVSWFGFGLNLQIPHRHHFISI